MKKLYFCVLDTETATLPIANNYQDEKTRRSIAIAKPLVYDIGWTICDRKGNIYKEVNYLVQETFFVPSIFNTAYYREKRPQYMERFTSGDLKALTWNEIIELLIEDLNTVDAVAAYNASFDFKKAIPFTEQYIENLYSANYNEWEKIQNKVCERIAENGKTGKNPNYLEPIFDLRGNEYTIIDLWTLSCKNLLNTNKYKNYCLQNDFITESGKFFKTSAEVVYSYLTGNVNFTESHTALDDAKIETYILQKIANRTKLEPDLTAFCFRLLGTIQDFQEM